jgi:hypothetical protein
MLHHENQVDSKYYMSCKSFMKLVNLFMPSIEQNKRKIVNSCREAAISLQHILGLTFHWLSGSSFHDIRDEGFFRVLPLFCLLHKVLLAIVNEGN